MCATPILPLKWTPVTYFSIEASLVSKYKIQWLPVLERCPMQYKSGIDPRGAMGGLLLSTNPSLRIIH